MPLRLEKRRCQAVGYKERRRESHPRSFREEVAYELGLEARMAF